jgi:carboxymuconolactone decarboxylase family protein
LSTRERSLCEVAEKLSAAPTRMTPADWQPLRDLGFDDLALLDVAYIVGVFNYLTRLADGFGLQLDRQVEEASKSQTQLRRIARDADVRPAEHDSRSDGRPDKPASESDPARRVEKIGMLSLAIANAGPSQPYRFGYRSEMGLLLSAHPRIGPAFGALSTEVMFAPGSLSRAEREMIAATAAAAQDCHY